MNHTKHFDYARLLSIPPTLPVVPGVGVVAAFAVVHQIEDTAQAYGHLEQGGQPAVLGQGVLVVPAPVCPEHGEHSTLKKLRNYRLTWTRSARKQLGCKTACAATRLGAGRPSPGGRRKLKTRLIPAVLNYLAKGHVGLAIEDGRVVRAVDGLAIT